MIEEFLTEVAAIQKTGVAREHAYRPALQKLFNALSEDVRAINEPAQVEVGAPDFVSCVATSPLAIVRLKTSTLTLRTSRGRTKISSNGTAKASQILYTPTV